MTKFLASKMIISSALYPTKLMEHNDNRGNIKVKKQETIIIINVS